MLNRTLVKSLTDWNKSPIRKPLVLRGARQVGKTSLVRDFGQSHFKSFLELNLDVPEIKESLSQAKSLSDLLTKASLITGQSLYTDQSLLFFDEIQEAPALMHMLRFFAEERPDLRVIAAGSLLEVKLQKQWSFPVGRVEYRYLHPLTFREFLSALDNQPALDSFSQLSLPTPQDSAHQFLTKLYQQYVLIGGMPEAVQVYLKSQDYMLVQQIYERLTASYLEDVYKYVPRAESYKYYEGILGQAARVAGKTFVYENFADLGYKSRDMAAAMDNLEKAMLIKQVHSLSHLQPELQVKHKRSKKLLVLDQGMMVYQAGMSLEVAQGKFAGRLMEQVVGQALMARSVWKNQPVYFWSRDKSEGTAEVDFVTVVQDKNVALEVKSGNTHQMKSFFSLLSLYPDTIPVRVSWDPLQVEKLEYMGQQYRILVIPFYLLDRLEELVGQFREL